MTRELRIGALISGGGTNLQAIIDACQDGRIDGRIQFVGSDNPQAFGLTRAQKHNLDTFVVNYGEILNTYRSAPGTVALPVDFDLASVRGKQTLFHADTDPGKVDHFLKSRALAEAALMKQIDAHAIDLLVMAGFMRIVTPYFIDRFNAGVALPRLMNIHPALLPAFPGTDGYGDTYGYGCKVGGCTVHFVDYGEDSGPIIGQAAFAIEPEDSLDDIKRKGLEMEWALYPHCIQLYARQRLELVPAPATGAAQGHRTMVRILPEGQA